MRSFVVALVLVMGAAPALADEPAKGGDRGRALFMQYCAGCHGGSAHGDGPIADALKTPPADLTRIAQRRGGRFPVAEVVAFIEGRQAVAAHGEREMPVWGERFEQMSPTGTPREKAATVRSKLDSLVSYLQSIQVTAP